MRFAIAATGMEGQKISADMEQLLSEWANGVMSDEEMIRRSLLPQCSSTSAYRTATNRFDESKAVTADFRHRALRHHAEGIFMAERFFGITITISKGRPVQVRLIGEQRVREDLGFVPSFMDRVRCIRPEPWMGRA